MSSPYPSGRVPFLALLLVHLGLVVQGFFAEDWTWDQVSTDVALFLSTAIVLAVLAGLFLRTEVRRLCAAPGLWVPYGLYLGGKAVLAGAPWPASFKTVWFSAEWTAFPLTPLLVLHIAWGAFCIGWATLCLGAEARLWVDKGDAAKARSHAPVPRACSRAALAHFPRSAALWVAGLSVQALLLALFLRAADVLGPLATLVFALLTFAVNLLTVAVYFHWLRRDLAPHVALGRGLASSWRHAPRLAGLLLVELLFVGMYVPISFVLTGHPGDDSLHLALPSLCNTQFFWSPDLNAAQGLGTHPSLDLIFGHLVVVLTLMVRMRVARTLAEAGEALAGGPSQSSNAPT